MIPPRLCFIVESGTDVRLVEGLAARYRMTIVARRMRQGVEISHPPALPVETMIGPASRIAFARAVAEHMWRGRHEFDFILVQGYGPSALACNLTGLATGVPTAMLVCSPAEAYYRCRREHAEPGKPYRPLELWVLQLLARANAWLGRHYVVLSDHLAEIVRHHGARGSIDVVPIYGVDAALFRPAAEPKVAVRRRLGLPEAGHMIFFSSRIAPEKDAETLLGAFSRLKGAGRDVWLLHRSGGYRRLLAAADRHNVRERVIATEAVHPRMLPEDYQASDLCVQASREEGLGYSPLEALACGVPVVASAVGGLTETIIDGQTGWTYPAGDAAALADAIGGALDDSAEANRRAAAGRALVLERYESRRSFERLADLIESWRQPAAIVRVVETG